MPYVSADHMSNAQPPWLAIKNPCEMKLLRRCLLASLHLSGRLISHGLTMPRSLHFVPPFGRERKSRRRQGLAKVSADVPVGAVANDVALRTLQANSCEGSVLSLELGWVWLQSHPSVRKAAAKDFHKRACREQSLSSGSQASARKVSRVLKRPAAKRVLPKL